MPDKVIKSDEEWKEQLSPEQYRVTRQKGTERPFTGEYHASKEEGTYRCVGCGAELFSSDTKFDSGTGWPSFWEPLEEENIKTEADNSLFMRRTATCSKMGQHRPVCATVSIPLPSSWTGRMTVLNNCLAKGATHLAYAITTAFLTGSGFKTG